MTEKDIGKESVLSALGSVNAFLAAHPEIEISKTGIAVPKEVRATFYSVVDEARFVLCEHILGQTDEFAAECVDKLKEALAKLEEKTGTGIVLPPELEAFCANMLDGASKPFFSSMLTFARGAIRENELLERASEEIPREFSRLIIAAYEAWLYYSIVLLMNPTKVYATRTTDQKNIETLPTSMIELGQQQYSAVLRMPEFVFESDYGTFGGKLELATDVDFYASKPLRRRDYTTGGDSRNMVGRRYLMLYQFTDPDSVSFLANRDTGLVRPPTALFGTFFPEDVEKNMYCKGSLQRVAFLKPKGFSCFVIPKELAEEIPPTAGVVEGRIELISTAFDLEALLPLIEAL